MKDTAFWSVFAPQIRGFLELKRGLGYKCGELQATLKTFDQFIIDHGYNGPGLNKEMTDNWASKNPNAAPITVYGNVGVIRQFSSYLRDQGIASYIPRLPKYPGNTFVPYIYSHEEMNAIFRAADSLRLKYLVVNSSFMAMPCLLRILYGTGIRISEALSLKNKDVNIAGCCLNVTDTKNGKDRLVPMSASLTSVCKDYLEHRSHLPVIGINHDNQPFFITPNGYKCNYDSVSNWFRKILAIAGIPYNGHGKKRARIHDIRHSFACHSFLNLSEGGIDLYCSWPYLSAYLGHQSLESTEQYIRITSQMYPELLKDTDELYVDILPEVPQIKHK